MPINDPTITVTCRGRVRSPDADSHGGHMAIGADPKPGMTPERAREPKVWEFEGDWYYLDAQGASHCANTKESAAILAAVKPLEEEIERLSRALADRVEFPKVCPITGRKFFMTIEHPERGLVPTYGGPFDSYTIPEPDDDGHMRSERYDHDRGEWIEGGEPEPKILLDTDEFNRMYRKAESAESAEQRVARLESAIRWALGESEDFRQREPGEGAYWWRKELRERAALSEPTEQREGICGICDSPVLFTESHVSEGMTERRHYHTRCWNRQREIDAEEAEQSEEQTR